MSPNPNTPEGLTTLLTESLGPFDLTDGRPALDECVDHSLMLRREVAWTRALPDDVFAHYVAWPRINNERLLPIRRAIWNELAPRIEGLTMERAAVEANYWCAEHVTYTPSDGRTISPLGALNRGIGRCGEESTLLVTVLRAIGIPARQIYTPRWAHCDDNHAWVEAMIDGTWRFMGACEPEEKLDRGWFDRASTRAMLVHCRVFNEYSCGNVNVSRSAGGDERELLENVTPNYAEVTDLTVRVADGVADKPIPGAWVSFELLNSAEYWPIAAARTDTEGRCSLQLGRGSVRVHVATEDSRMADATVNTAETNSLTITLDGACGTDCVTPNDNANARIDTEVSPTDANGATTHAYAAQIDTEVSTTTANGAATHGSEVWNDTKVSQADINDGKVCDSACDGWTLTNLVAPPSNPSRAAVLTAEERERGVHRAGEAEAMRVARLKAFADEAATGDARRDALTAKAGGNWRVLADFLDADANCDRLALLEALNDKDLADVTAEQLADAYAGAQAVRNAVFAGTLAERDEAQAQRIWRECVLNPRVNVEELTANREPLQKALQDTELGETWRKEPALVAAWLRGHNADNAAEAVALAEEPAGVAMPLDIHRMPLRNDIAFVRVCRALGVPARLDPETEEPQWFDGADFVSVTCVEKSHEDTEAQETGGERTTTLRLDSGARPAPRYWVDWSLGRLADTAHGRDWVSLDLTERAWETVDNGQSSLMELALAPGDYRLITTVRLPNGNQQVCERAFALADGQNADATLAWREPSEDELLEHIELEEVSLTAADGTAHALRDLVAADTANTAAVTGDAAHTPHDLSGTASNGAASSDAAHPPCGATETISNTPAHPAVTVLCVLDAHGSEPSIHVLDELRSYLERNGGLPEGVRLVMATSPAGVAPASNIEAQLARLPERPALFSCERAAAERMARITFVDPEKLPLIEVVRPEDDKLIATYASAGYSVGSVDLSLRLAAM